MKQYTMKAASKSGILFENQEETLFIDFQECAQSSPVGHNCIGERDITKRLFVFFTRHGKTSVVVGRFPNWKLFASYNSRAFEKVQNAIKNSRYSTYDLS